MNIFEDDALCSNHREFLELASRHTSIDGDISSRCHSNLELHPRIFRSKPSLIVIPNANLSLKQVLQRICGYKRKTTKKEKFLFGTRPSRDQRNSNCK
jgi:hypothetical protein